MKKRVSILSGILCFLCLALGAQIPTNGLISEWTFSGNANDAVGSNHGVVNGASLTTNRCGTPNSAYYFDGVNDYIVMPNAGPTGTVSRSLSFWAKTTNTVINNPVASFCYGTSNANGGSFEVVWNYCSQGVGLDVSNHAIIRSNACIENNAWHHIAIVHDASIGTSISSPLYYIDGVVQPNLTCFITGSTAVINTINTFPITIGKASNMAVRFWDGSLDDYYLYNRALTQQEVLQLYNALPCTAPVYGNPVPCGGASVYSIQPITGVTYTWTFPNGWTGSSSTNSISLSGYGPTGPISVTYSSAACNFSGTATGTVSAGFTPISFTATSNSPLCANATLSLLTSVPSNSYSWSGPNNFTSTVQNPTLANVGSAASGVYSLTLLDGSCSTATVSVTVNPLPTLTLTNVTGSQSLTCIYPSVDLMASSNYTFGALNYYWSSASFTASTPSITVTNPSTLISIVVSDQVTGCARTATIAIGIDQVVPVVNVNPINQNVTCGQGAFVTATACAVSPSINISHAWYSPTDPIIQGGGQCSIYAMSTPDTYTHVITNMINGCTTTTTLQIVSSLGFPIFNLTSPAPYNFTVGCASKSVAVVNIVDQDTRPFGGGAMSFTMLPPGFSQPSYGYSTTLTFSVTTPGNYTFITRDNANGCETRIIKPIIQDIFPPNATVNVATRTLTCFSPTVMLEGLSTTTNVSYAWRFLNGQNPNTVLNSTILSQTNGSTAISATVVNVYSLTVTNNNNLCTTTTVVSIYQNIRPPKPIINGAGGLSCIILERTLVNGSAVDEAPAFFVPLGTASTKWEGPSPQEPDSSVVSNYKAKTVGIYTMTVMDLNNGCITKTTVNVPDHKVYPTLLTNTLVTLDCGANTSGVKLSAVAVGLKPVDVDALWLPPMPPPNMKNANTLTLTTDGVGEYTLMVTTFSNGCKSDIKVNVIDGLLNADFTPDVVEGFAPLSVNFANNSASSSSVSGTSSITSVWSFGNGTTRTTTTNVTTSAVYQQPGTYTITLFTSKGTCSDTISKVIFVDIPSKLQIPNIFTPNGDNSNDVFFIKGANLVEISATIYDRWGTKVYELITGKGNIAWDGKNLSGAESSDGTYFYIITAKGKDGQSYDVKGTVTLVR